MYGSCYTQFELEHPERKKLAVGPSSVSSQEISAAGHLWRIDFHPRGYTEDDAEYVSILLKLVSDSNNVKAILHAFVVDTNGQASSSHDERESQIYPPDGNRSNCFGWPRFAKRSDLGSFVWNGVVTITCGVIIEPEPVDNNPLCVPPSDIGSHLGKLLDSPEGSDVSFVVDGDTFPAHRTILASRSPVFKAQLLGSMADAKMPSITLHDIAAATFKVMLRFMYTDALPGDDELGDSPIEVFEDLLAVADRYALDRLKLMCATKLWENVTVDTIVATLSCAETYNCPELKRKCIAFFADEKNFKKVVLTDGYIQMAQKFPSILAELREKMGT
ncbi:hypothetical protein EJB05_48231, partial [Eragrostis curvula]